MASEDSDQISSGLAVIHRLRDPCDLDQARHREVPTCCADLNAPRKRLEVVPLRRAKRMLPKERNHDPEEIIASTDDVAIHMLLVVVVAPVDRHSAHAK